MTSRHDLPTPAYDAAQTAHQSRVTDLPAKQADRSLIVEMLAPKPGEALLDIGCGDGALVAALAQAVEASGIVHGLDSSRDALPLARARCPAGCFHLGDATALPFDDGTLDGVTASQVLCFVPDVDKALAELARVLRPGGRAVILDTDWDTLAWAAGDRALMARAIARFTASYADPHVPRRLTQRLQDAGLQVTARQARTIVDFDRSPDTLAALASDFLKMLATNDSDRESPFSSQWSLADWHAWEADQQATDAAGHFLFSLTRFAFAACKSRS